MICQSSSQFLPTLAFGDCIVDGSYIPVTQMPSLNDISSPMHVFQPICSHMERIDEIEVSSVP